MNKHSLRVPALAMIGAAGILLAYVPARAADPTTDNVADLLNLTKTCATHLSGGAWFSPACYRRYVLR